MNIRYLLATSLCVVLAGSVVGAQDMDSALSAMTENLAAQIKAKGDKKITVIDFTDLEGNTSELGRYIAEQLTVDFVMTNRPFAVLDRANTQRILREHNLTARGLVDPTNAMQFGKFAGVDAMIFGTITPIGTNLTLTATIIRTDTSVIDGGTKAHFAMNDTIKGLMSQATKEVNLASSVPYAEQKQVPSGLATKQVKNLIVTIEKVQQLNDGVMVYAAFKNADASNEIAVAIQGNPTYGIYKCSLTSSNGTDYNFDNFGLTGLHFLNTSPSSLTDIDPGSTLDASFKFDPANGGRVSSSSGYTFQMEIVLNNDYNADTYNGYQVQNTLPPDCETFGLMFEIPPPRH